MQINKACPACGSEMFQFIEGFEGESTCLKDDCPGDADDLDELTREPAHLCGAPDCPRCIHLDAE